jgi:hypothetical protein
MVLKRAFARAGVRRGSEKPRADAVVAKPTAEIAVDLVLFLDREPGRTRST